MAIDSTPQPCPHCLRSTVLFTRAWGREWLHVGTWRAHCERPAHPRQLALTGSAVTATRQQDDLART